MNFFDTGFNCEEAPSEDMLFAVLFTFLCAPFADLATAIASSQPAVSAIGMRKEPLVQESNSWTGNFFLTRRKEPTGDRLRFARCFAKLDRIRLGCYG